MDSIGLVLTRPLLTPNSLAIFPEAGYFLARRLYNFLTSSQDNCGAVAVCEKQQANFQITAYRLPWSNVEVRLPTLESSFSKITRLVGEICLHVDTCALLRNVGHPVSRHTNAHAHTHTCPASPYCVRRGYKSSKRGGGKAFL